jgi:hypothetical protein
MIEITAHIAYEDEKQCVVHVDHCGNIIEGVSSCHRCDEFDVSVGRQVALANALLHLSMFIRSSALGNWPDNKVVGYVNPVSRSYCPVCKDDFHAKR